jgi:hypothetical protein
MQNAPIIFGVPQGDPDPAQSEPISYNHHDAVRCMELANDGRPRMVAVPIPKDKVWPETETKINSS